jgi:hypothetical protein
LESKIRIRMGDLEVEYEGSEDFLRKELPAILHTVAGLHASGDAKGVQGRGASPKHPALSVRHGSLSTSVVATKLGGQTGGDLALAAAAKLVLADESESFSRDVLLKEMRSAKSFFKATYSKNLSGYIKNLVKAGRLNELGNEHYALSNTAKGDAEQALAKP